LEVFDLVAIMVQRNARTASVWSDDDRVADLAVQAVFAEVNVFTMLSNAVVCVAILSIGMNSRKHAIFDCLLKACAQWKACISHSCCSFLATDGQLASKPASLSGTVFSELVAAHVA
jgi:hypothetical protein